MQNNGERVVATTCNSHCGGACVLKVHIKDGVITRIETDDGEEPQMRACLKGRSYRQRVYHPDRILYPLKRVGERGEGKFERISWDEALETVASELKRVSGAYGPEAILFKYSGGDIAWVHGAAVVQRLLNMLGGFSNTWGFYSFEGGVFAEYATYGTCSAMNTRDNLLHSRMIIMWGWNPSVTIQETNTAWYLAQARERGAAIASVDPRYTESAAAFAQQWIPIIPGTDAAMLVAMAHVIIRENLQDDKFLGTSTIGFDRFKDYVLGAEDGVPKTAAWAESITGVPAATIERLATEYATTKPAALIAGIGPGRSAYGEQYHRLAITLAAITGNIGVLGGDAAGRSWTAGYTGYPFIRLGKGIRAGINPVEQDVPPRKYALPPHRGLLRQGRVNVAEMADAILRGKAGGYPADYKLLWVHYTSFPNQYLNVNKYIQALKALEFVIMSEQFLHPGTKYADIVLPANTFLERNDITTGLATGFYGYMNKSVEPLGESKSSLEMSIALAEKLDLKDFNELTEEEWIQEAARAPDEIKDYGEFKAKGVVKVHRPEPYIAFREQVEEPQNHPFATPSGKIEIFSQRLADMDTPVIPPVPKYIEAWEGRNDPLAEKYPLQLITTHSKRRAHSQFENIPWLRELEKQQIHIAFADAEARGIKEGDMVKVFNDRGQMVIPAMVTERMMPGVVDIPQGAWFDVDEDGIDRGGCANVLTRDAHSPAGAYCTNTTLVQVARVR